MTRGKFLKFITIREDGIMVLPKEARLHLGVEGREGELAVFLDNECVVIYPKDAVKVVVAP